jgi:hypothetical protein
MTALALHTQFTARDTAITQRPTSTAILAIDSEDRFADYNDARKEPGAVPGRLNRSPYDFTIRKNESLMNGFFTRLGVTEVVFPWTLPNINLGTSSVRVTYDVGAGDVTTTVTLDLGFYTPSMIASALQTAIRNLDAGLAAFTMTYGVETLIGGTTTQNPIFEYQTNDPAVTIGFSPMPQTGPVYSNPLRKQLFDLLGFTDYNNNVQADGQGNVTYCQFTRYIDIVCTQLTANQALKDTMSQVIARDVLCRVYIGDAQGVQSTVLPSSSTFCPPGCMPTTIYRDFTQPKQIMWIPNQPVPGFLQFTVYDDSGTPLTTGNPAADGAGAFSYGNGANWSMTMLVTEN